MLIGIAQFIYLGWTVMAFAKAAASRRRWLVHSMQGFLFSGIALHLLWIINRGIDAGRLPIANTYETLILLGFLLISGYAAYSIFYKNLYRIAGLCGIVTTLLLGFSSLLSSDIEPLMPALKSNWFALHIISVFIAYAAFTLSFCASSGYLLLGKKKADILDSLDEFSCRMINIGFPLLTLGLAAGAVWANLSWGRYWNWDPKETFAFITWLIYAAYLHLRRTRKAVKTYAAVLSVAGFLFMIFTYFGINYIFSSLHSY